MLSNYDRPASRPKARIAHRCIACYWPVAVGEVYVQQTGYCEGSAYRNRYHAECWDALDTGDEFEFIPGGGDPPDRLLAPDGEPPQ